MLTPKEMKGIMCMMPAFTTKDGDRIDAIDTVDTQALSYAVDKIITDGADVIATTGSFGEFHTLLWEEHKKLIETTVAAARKRVPVIIGCTSLNTRETMRQARFAQDAGADGILIGVPFYFPATVDNAVQFYHDVADAFPKLGIVIYHNPPLHRITLPVSAFKKLIEKPNLVAMKDSHRTPLQFMDLINTVQGRISIFCNQVQAYPYVMLGAAGCWSFTVWMGPSPVLRLRDAFQAQEWATTKTLCLEMGELMGRAAKIGDLSWRESSYKLAINYADYCAAGPLRPPFRSIPPEVIENSRRIAEDWKKLVAKYPPGRLAKSA